MKFVNELSYERYCLLSEEDKRIYDYEHPKNEGVRQPIISTNIINEEYEQHVKEATCIVAEDMKYLIREIGAEEYMIEELGNDYGVMLESIANDIIRQRMPLNEVEGKDFTWWTDCGWLGKLALGGLFALITLLAALIRKGLDKLAIEKLKAYMNKLVELTDDGVQKKKPWYSFFIKSDNIGEHNKTCLRTIQETYDRKMTDAVILNAKACGMLPSKDDGSYLTSHRVPSNGCGLYDFKKNVIDQLGIKN